MLRYSLESGYEIAKFQKTSCRMSKSGKLFRGLRSFTQGFFIGVPICLTFTDNFCTICQVEGISMQPVLNSNTRRGDFVLINRWKAKQFQKIKIGDIVSIISPKNPDTVFIKRIIGLEGDIVRTLSFKEPVIKIPKGHCWIEGDNHKHSFDSNSFGSVPLGLVNGVATRVIWPPSRWGKLTNQVPAGRNPFGQDTFGYTGLNNMKGNTQDPVCINMLTDELENSTGMNKVSDCSQTINSNDKIKSKSLLTHLPQNS